MINEMRTMMGRDTRIIITTIIIIIIVAVPAAHKINNTNNRCGRRLDEGVENFSAFN